MKRGLMYVAAQIVTSNSVKRAQQRFAASLVGTLNLYVSSLGLGFAGTIEIELNGRRMDMVPGFRAALFLLELRWDRWRLLSIWSL
jgi:hypothetical protein